MTWIVFKNKFIDLCNKAKINTTDTASLTEAVDHYINIFESTHNENATAIQIMAENMLNKLVGLLEQKPLSIKDSSQDLRIKNILEFADSLQTSRSPANLTLEDLKGIKKEYDEDVSEDKLAIQQQFIALIMPVFQQIKSLKNTADGNALLAAHGLASHVIEQINLGSQNSDSVEKIQDLKNELNYLNIPEFLDSITDIMLENKVYETALLEPIATNIAVAADYDRILDKLSLHIDSIEYLDMDSLHSIGKSIKSISFDSNLWETYVTFVKELPSDEFAGKLQRINNLQELIKAMKLVDATDLAELKSKKDDLAKLYAAHHLFDMSEHLQIQYMTEIKDLPVLSVIVPAIFYLCITNISDDAAQEHEANYYASLFHVDTQNLQQAQVLLLRVLGFVDFDIDKNPESTLLMLARLTLEERDSYLLQHKPSLDPIIYTKAATISTYVRGKIDKFIAESKNKSSEQLSSLLSKYQARADETVNLIDKVDDHALYIETIAQIKNLMRDKEDKNKRNY